MSDWWSADPVAAEGPPLQISPRVPNPALAHPSARDLAIRTVYGEAGNEPPEGQAGVAAVIRNRLDSGRYGNTVPQVVLAPSQFEPWQRPDARARMVALKPGDPDYERIGGIVDRVFSGDMEDPTQGATHFFSPGAQAALGRRAPTWARGEPLTIGGHAFYAPEGRATEVSAQRRQPEPSGDWWAADPVAEQGDTFSDRFGGMAPTTAKGLRGGLEEQAAAMTRGPQTSPGQAMAIDYGNILSSAQQGTTGQIASHQPNLISTDVFQSDSGEVMFRDPQTGQVVPTDASKHVALRDPADNRVKVYARAPETEAGPLESGAKVLSAGMLAGAPTARPGLALARAAPVNEIAQSADRIGVAVPRAVASDSMITQQAGAVTRNVPFAGTPVVRAAERTVEQLGDRAEDVARGFGGGNAASSGEAAKSGIKDWITGRSAEAATRLYDKVDEIVNPTVTAPLDNTRRAVGEISAKRTLSARPAMGTAEHVVTAALERPEGLTYEGIKGLRTSVRDMLDRGVLPPNMTMQELESVYKGLSADLRVAAETAGGPKGLAAFERANRFYAQVSERRQALAKIIGANGDAPPEQVFDRLVAKASSGSRADITALAQARKAIGSDDWDEFVSGVVMRMGRDGEGNFSPRKFLTAYSNNLSDAGRSVLFKSTGKTDLAQHLDDIATISGRFKELEKFANPSGTGRTVMGGGILAGGVTDPLTTLAAVVGARGLAMALARPVTAAPTANWSRAYLKAVTSPSPSTIAGLNVASRNLANTFTAAGIQTTAQDVMRGIQGPVRAPADNEQQ